MRCISLVAAVWLLSQSVAHGHYFVRISDLRYAPAPPNPIRTCGLGAHESPFTISDGRSEIQVCGIAGKLGDFLIVEGNWNGSVLYAESMYWSVPEEPI